MKRGDVHHLPESLALEHLAHLWAHGGKLGIGSDEGVHDLRVGHDRRHLLEELRVVEHALHLECKACQEHCDIIVY